jgi:two-component system, NarL family, response regulator LiaR
MKGRGVSEHLNGSNGSVHEHGVRTKLLIVDHAPTRHGIKIVLGADVEVVAEADDAEQAIRSAKREQPSVALVGMDVCADWRAVVRGVCRAAPGCAVVVLAQTSDADDMLESVRAGAVGYVPGSLDEERLRRVFRAVSDREAVVPRAMVIELLGELRGGQGGGEVLTGREAQVLGMLRRGHSTAWIADRLQIAPVTVRRHVSELVHKLGVESRSDLIEQNVG